MNELKNIQNTIDTLKSKKNTRWHQTVIKSFSGLTGYTLLFSILISLMEKAMINEYDNKHQCLDTTEFDKQALVSIGASFLSMIYLTYHTIKYIARTHDGLYHISYNTYLRHVEPKNEEAYKNVLRWLNIMPDQWDEKQKNEKQNLDLYFMSTKELLRILKHKKIELLQPEIKSAFLLGSHYRLLNKKDPQKTPPIYHFFSRDTNRDITRLIFDYAELLPKKQR